jgi:hypothetical protein
MSDRMPAEIWLGGKCPRSALEEAPFDGLFTDWEDLPIDASSEETILAARNDDGHLHFADTEACYGEFPELESWAREHKIPFRRHHTAKYEHDGEIVFFRPDVPRKRDQSTWVWALQDGTPVVPSEAVQKVVTKMQVLVDGKSKLPCREQLARWDRLLRQLRRSLPPELPPLPKFEIVDG